MFAQGHPCGPRLSCGFGGLVDPKHLIDFFEVPGAFEIPLQAKLLARTSRYVAIVAAGFVVDGGITMNLYPTSNQRIDARTIGNRGANHLRRVDAAAFSRA